MKLFDTPQPKVRKIVLDEAERFVDHRGTFTQTYSRPHYNMLLPGDVDMVQGDLSFSYKNVLRGIHGDEKTWKLLTCAHGRIFVVVVCGPDFDDPDTRKDHYDWSITTTPRVCEYTLQANDGVQLLVPPHYGVGHLVLSETAALSYMQSTSYTGGEQFTMRWDDPALGIDWPLSGAPVLSKRDRHARKIHHTHRNDNNQDTL